MSITSRMAARTIIETVLTLGGWGLVIASGIAFFSGNPQLGFGLGAGAVLAFIIAAVSHRSKPTRDYIPDGVGRLYNLLRAGRYDEAHRLSGELLRLSQGNEPLMVLMATWRTLTCAVTGDYIEARNLIARANSEWQSLPSYVREQSTEVPKVLSIIDRELAVKVPQRHRLVERVLEAFGALDDT